MNTNIIIMMCFVISKRSIVRSFYREIGTENEQQ